MREAGMIFSDTVICYFLDTFLMLYCLVATALFFREKFCALQVAEPNDETNDVYQELNLEMKEDPYDVLKSEKKKRDKKKKTGKIFTEPGSLSMSTIQKLREKCRQQILEEESRRP
ncbi:T-cell surface glycoprotein CD3 zeta chain isoform X1 [Oryzias latipes]|uniref:T-cell surface glycoprotein CD3 zeta chain isoform X1 n=1 Tax=Oryzias latipes TaxID=8090 RepID=UPI0005CC856F|nr:T-cell surface glycoprotein CD3 zeta chain isoform X1 [Oryzias latipes]